MSISGIGSGGQGGYQFDLGSKLEKQGAETTAQSSQASGTPAPQATASAPGGAAATSAPSVQESSDSSSQSERPRGATEPGVGGKLDISA